MSRMTFAKHLVLTLMLVVLSARVSVAGNVGHARHVGGGSLKTFVNHKPVSGYYTRHGQYVPGAGDQLIFGPGYVFVPGRGVLDEACNLPTSTCPNEYRDIQ